MKKILGNASVAKRLPFLMTADKVAGDIVVENGLIGVLLDDTADEATGLGYVETDERGAGPFPLAAVEVSRYDIAYYDTGNSVFTNVQGSNIQCGIFLDDAADSDGEISAVWLTGQLTALVPAE